MYVEHRCDVIQTVFSSWSLSLYARQYKILEEQQCHIQGEPVLSGQGVDQGCRQRPFAKTKSMLAILKVDSLFTLWCFPMK